VQQRPRGPGQDANQRPLSNPVASRPLKRAELVESDDSYRLRKARVAAGYPERRSQILQSYQEQVDSPALSHCLPCQLFYHLHPSGRKLGGGGGYLPLCLPAPL